MNESSNAETPTAPAAADFPATPSSDLLIRPPDLVAGHEIPPLSLRSMILLEAAESPLITPEQRDPETGEMVRVRPRMLDIAVAFFILTHQTDPKIGQYVANKAALEHLALELSATVSIADMHRLAALIAGRVQRVADATEESGLKRGNGGATGPSVSSTP